MVRCTSGATSHVETQFARSASVEPPGVVLRRKAASCWVEQPSGSGHAAGSAALADQDSDDPYKPFKMGLQKRYSLHLRAQAATDEILTWRKPWQATKGLGLHYWEVVRGPRPDEQPGRS